MVGCTYEVKETLSFFTEGKKDHNLEVYGRPNWDVNQKTPSWSVSNSYFYLMNGRHTESKEEVLDPYYCHGVNLTHSSIT